LFEGKNIYFDNSNDYSNKEQKVIKDGKITSMIFSNFVFVEDRKENTT